MGHECKENNVSHIEADAKEEKKTKGEKMWIPSAIVKVMKDVINIEELRVKLAKPTPIEEEKFEVECRPSNKPQSQITTHMRN